MVWVKGRSSILWAQNMSEGYSVSSATTIQDGFVGRKTGSTLVYTLFVRSGEECSSIAQEVVTVIKNVTIFLDFCKALKM